MFRSPSRTASLATFRQQPLPTPRALERGSGRSAARTAIALTLLMAALVTGSLLLAVLSTVALLLPRPGDHDGHVTELDPGSGIDVVPAAWSADTADALPAGPTAAQGTPGLTSDDERRVDAFRAQLRALPELDPRG